MSQLTDIIIKSGIVPANVLEEAKRWGLPTGNAEPPTDLQAEMTVEKFCEAIDEAMSLRYAAETPSHTTITAPPASCVVAIPSS